MVRKYAGILAALLVVGLFFFLIRPSGKNGRFRIETFSVEKGWGYRILDGDSLLIHQPFIPVIPGVKRFRTKREAELTGQLTLQKIEQGLFPPSLTLRELDSLGIAR